MELRNALRRLRSETGLTQTELAGALHVSFTTVSRWENKFTRPNQAASVAIIELAKARNVSDGCLDALNQTLFASRAELSAEDELERAVSAPIRVQSRVITAEQLKMTIENLDLGIVAQRFTKPSADCIEFFYQNDFFANLLGYPHDEYYRRLAENPFFAVAPETLDNFKSQLQGLLTYHLSMRDFSVMIQMLKADGSRLWIEVQAISLQIFPYGQELFTACRDVTKRIQTEQAYQRELLYRRASLRGNCASLHIDLTDNRVLLNLDIAKLTGRPYDGETADELLLLIAEGVSEGKLRKNYLSSCSRAALIDSFERRNLYGRIGVFCTVMRRWIGHEYILLKNPINSHIEVLIFATDIQERVIDKKLLDIISEHFFDYIGSIDVATRRLETVYNASLLQSEVPAGDYAICRQKLASIGGLEEPPAETALEYILEQLEKHEFYSVVVEHQKDGKAQREKLIYTYLDETRELIIIVQCDCGVLGRACESLNNQLH